MVYTAYADNQAQAFLWKNGTITQITNLAGSATIYDTRFEDPTGRFITMIGGCSGTLCLYDAKTKQFSSFSNAGDPENRSLYQAAINTKMQQLKQSNP